MSRDEDLRITLAAVKVGEKLYTGRRHCNCIHDAIADGIPRVSADMQGFLASDGKFYNRFQAGSTAYRAGQTGVRKCELTSEDVW